MLIALPHYKIGDILVSGEGCNYSKVKVYCNNMVDVLEGDMKGAFLKMEDWLLVTKEHVPVVSIEIALEKPSARRSSYPWISSSKKTVTFSEPLSNAGDDE